DQTGARARHRAHAPPSFLNSRDEFAILDMGGDVDRIGGRAGKMREQGKTDQGKYQRNSSKSGDYRQRPRRRRQQSITSGDEEQRIGNKGDQENSDVGESRTDHDN